MSDIELDVLSDVEKPSKKSVGDEEEENNNNKQTLLGAAMNLANSTMGAGILGLPFVFKEGGVLLALGMLLVASWLADVSLNMLLEAFELSGRKSTYEEIGEHCFGTRGKAVVSVGSLSVNFGALVAYYVIIADLVAPLVDVSREFAMTVGCFLIVPLSYLRLSALAPVSSLSVVLVMSFVLIVVVQFAKQGIQGPVHLVHFSPKIIQLTGVVVFAFSCHTNVVPIAHDTHPETNSHHAVHLSVITCVVLYGVVSICGYLTLLDHTPPNYLAYFSHLDILLSIFRLTLAISIILTTPLAVRPGVIAVCSLWSSLNKSIVLPCFVVLALSIALFVPNLIVAFSLAGIVGSSSVCYMIPPILVLKLKKISLTDFPHSWKYLGLCVFGMVFCVVGLSAQIIELL